MNKSQMLIFSFALSLVIGFILGRYSMSDIKEESKTDLIVKRSNKHHSFRNKSKPIIKDPDSLSLKDCESKDKTKNEDEDNHFDAYDYRQQHEESLQKWDESFSTFLGDEFENPPQYLSQYKTLQEDLKTNIKNWWDKIKERSKIEEDHYYMNTTFHEDLEKINIRKEYHQKLIKLLGDKVYKSYVEKIKRCRASQVERVRESLPAGYCPRD